jgi:hypothetical protein
VSAVVRSAMTNAQRAHLRPRGAAVGASMLIVALLAAACGGGSGPTGVASISATSSSTTAPAPAGGTSQAAEYTNGLKYADCMRAHGEPGFPDPANPGGFPSAAIERLDPSSTLFSSANSRCVRLLPNDGRLTPAELAQVLERGLKFAQCMRAHGQLNFPDPGVSGGQITINFNDLDPNSPQYRAAEQTCGRIINA